jgi:hypothetical protein
VYLEHVNERRIPELLERREGTKAWKWGEKSFGSDLPGVRRRSLREYEVELSG